MEQNVVKPRGLLFSFALAVTIICVATAFVCGGILLLNSLGEGAAKSSAREYYAVGTYYDSLSAAKTKAEGERTSGRAGYVISESAGFFLVSALYGEVGDAKVVAERIKAETLTVKIAQTKFTGEDKSLCTEAVKTLSEVVDETEKLWRQLDAAETSESLVVKMLGSYASALAEYAAAGDGVGEVVTRVRVILTEAATGGKYPLTADVKYASAATAALLAEYAASRL